MVNLDENRSVVS